MTNSKNRIKAELKVLFILSSFNRIKPDRTNIKEVYRNNLLKWYMKNSDSVETKDGQEIDKTSHELINPNNIIVSKTKEGFNITERDFISYELRNLKSLDIETLKLSEKKQFQYYYDFLNDLFKNLPKELTPITFEEKLNEVSTKLQSYQNAIGLHFKNCKNKKNPDGSNNNLYYEVTLNNWAKQRIKDIDENENYKEVSNLLKEYIESIKDTYLLTISLFNKIEEIKIEQAKNDTELQRISILLYQAPINIKQDLENKSRFIDCIKENIVQGNYTLALQLQDFFLIRIEELHKICIDIFNINLNNTPLKESFDNTVLRIKESIDVERVKLLQNNNEAKTKPNNKNNPKTQETNYNPNHFNQKGYELFLYLVDNYEKKGKVKFLNIFKFMKNSINKEQYVFRFTQEKYTSFIKAKYSTEIKKYQTAQYMFEDVEKPILNELETQYRQQNV